MIGKNRRSIYHMYGFLGNYFMYLYVILCWLVHPVIVRKGLKVKGAPPMKAFKKNKISSAPWFWSRRNILGKSIHFLGCHMSFAVCFFGYPGLLEQKKQSEGLAGWLESLLRAEKSPFRGHPTIEKGCRFLLEQWRVGYFAVYTGVRVSKILL